MQDRKNQVEAILFTTGRFMTLEEIGQVCGMGSPGFVKEVISELKKDYSIRESSLELQEHEGKWKLALRRNYVYVTSKLLDDSELDRPTQESLAVIAYKNPILQCDLIKIRGNKAYDHIHYLIENGFVISEKYGRTRILKLTQKFFDYFDVAESELTKQFGKVVEDVVDKFKKAKKGELKKEDFEKTLETENIVDEPNIETQIVKEVKAEIKLNAVDEVKIEEESTATKQDIKISQNDDF
ncbi:SMC-Scp complex subunit ScpB [Candidatus Woesearchaeota archaeon]|nr:SMC-Scp complex subunit ScpB [Candidatus Woesearchaeota archaeon]